MKDDIELHTSYSISPGQDRKSSLKQEQSLFSCSKICNSYHKEIKIPFLQANSSNYSQKMKGTLNVLAINNIVVVYILHCFQYIVLKSEVYCMIKEMFYRIRQSKKAKQPEVVHHQMTAETIS